MSRLSHRRETEEGRSPWRIEAAAVSDCAAETPPETAFGIQDNDGNGQNDRYAMLTGHQIAAARALAGAARATYPKKSVPPLMPAGPISSSSGINEDHQRSPTG